MGILSILRIGLRLFYDYDWYNESKRIDKFPTIEMAEKVSGREKEIFVGTKDLVDESCARQTCLLLAPSSHNYKDLKVFTI